MDGYRDVIIRPGDKIVLGQVGDERVTRIIFNVKKHVENIGPGGTWSVVLKQAGAEEAYPCAFVDFEDDQVKWVVSHEDAAVEGYGEAQLICVKSDKVMYSKRYETYTARSLDVTSEIPEPWVPWIDRFVALAGAAEEAYRTAETYASDAYTYKEEASVSALRAADSERRAGNILTTVRDIENDVKQIQTDVHTSEANAAASKEAAEAAANEAELSAENAAEEANAAAAQARLSQRSAEASEDHAADSEESAAAAQSFAADANNTLNIIKEKLASGEFIGPPGKDGAPGKDGEPGRPGRDGSDATVTEAAINAALRTDVKETFQQLENRKIDKPSDVPQVGKVLKIKSVNEDGTFVCEWGDGGSDVDLTDYVKNTDYATNEKGGVVKLPTSANSTDGGSVYIKNGVPKVNTNRNYGIYYSDGYGSLRISDATAQDIDNQRENSGNYTVIVPHNLDYAVKAALTDRKGAAYTEEEQKAARERIGASGGKFELIETVTVTEAVERITRGSEPNGTPYHFKRMRLIVRTPVGQPVTAFANVNGGSSINNAICRISTFGNAIYTGFGVFDCDVSSGMMDSYAAFSYGSSANSSNLIANPRGFGFNGSGNVVEFVDEITEITFAVYQDKLREGTVLYILGVRA